MLDKQILTDQQGTPMGVFIPMRSWNNLIFQYPDIESLDTDLPQWEKEFIDKRLDMTHRYPERLKPVEMLYFLTGRGHKPCEKAGYPKTAMGVLT